LVWIKGVRTGVHAAVAVAMGTEGCSEAAIGSWVALAVVDPHALRAKGEHTVKAMKEVSVALLGRR